MPPLNTAMSHSFVVSVCAGKVTLATDGRGNKSEAQIDFWGPVEVLAHIKESSLQITTCQVRCNFFKCLSVGTY